MKHFPEISRRHFVKLAAFASGGVALSGQVVAAEATVHSLAPLPYPASALEPHIDARTMEIHHGKHHQAYVTGLNTALASAPELATKPLETLLADLPAVSKTDILTPLRNHGGGHWNHTFFWAIMAPPAAAGKPSAELAKAIDSAFGSMDGFKKTFAEAAAKRFGSGWAWLIARDGQLKITSTPNQDNPLMKGLVPDADLGTPLLGIDVWEHAYYLHYQNRRPDYVTAWWNVVNWNEVSKRFAAA
jgi:superoxide dismutase, Fe-Mn family